MLIRDLKATIVFRRTIMVELVGIAINIFTHIAPFFCQCDIFFGMPYKRIGLHIKIPAVSLCDPVFCASGIDKLPKTRSAGRSRSGIWIEARFRSCD